MRPILSIVGRANSGKTTFLEEFIVALRGKGHRVAVIKHANEDFEMDTRGKDTWRFSQAGSDLVAISTPRKLAVVKKLERDLSPQEIARGFEGAYDIILTEGFKQANTYQIEVHRREQGHDLVSKPDQLLAVITDEPLEVAVPQFDRGEIDRIVALVESRILAKRQEEVTELYVNDTFVPLNQFVKDILEKVLLGVISTLKGIREIRSIRILLRRGD